MTTLTKNKSIRIETLRKICNIESVFSTTNFNAHFKAHTSSMHRSLVQVLPNALFGCNKLEIEVNLVLTLVSIFHIYALHIQKENTYCRPSQQNFRKRICEKNQGCS